MKQALAQTAATLLLSVGLISATSAATLPSYDTFKSWLIACDNALTCEAKGFTEGTGSSELRVIRSAGPSGKTHIALEVASDQPVTLDDLRVDGRTLGLDASAWVIKNEQSDSLTTVSTDQPAAIDQLLSQLRNGKVLQVGHDPDAVVPLDGMVAALLKMDDRQGRVGGVTALMKKGAAPASEVPPAPDLPVVHPHTTTAQLSGSEQQSLIKTFSATAQGKPDECDRDAAQSDDTSSAYALDANTALVFIPCIAGAYQSSSKVFLVSRQTQMSLPLHLPSPDGKETENMLTEASFDPQTSTLAEFAKGRGLADCGFETQWIWDGKAFELANASLQMQCGGGSAGEFPTIYRSRP